ncbi:MAG: hypothetical protein KDK30_02570 [Leptospiraceae bacterium]|nr:hypothetical protein [Leptospiraceae bacterium]
MVIPDTLYFYGFLLLLLLLAVQRLLELRLSRSNERALLSRGGREHAPGHFRAMKILHTLWLPAILLEVIVLQRACYLPLALPAMLLLIAGQSLRYAAIHRLGERWTVKIITIPDAPPVRGGIFNWIRHPNYLGVILEIGAVPLIHSAFISAIVFSMANAIILYIRIQAEERALASQNSYMVHFEHTPRLIGIRSGKKSTGR